MQVIFMVWQKVFIFKCDNWHILPLYKLKYETYVNKSIFFIKGTSWKKERGGGRIISVILYLEQ